jgi:aminomethyltransferase
MRLYGNDIDETTTVLEAGLGWTVGWKKDSFIGHERLREQKAAGHYAEADWLRDERAWHRQAWASGASRRKAVGVVTSGTQTPFLKKSIGMAYVPIELAGAGTEIDIDIRGRVVKARVVPMPFYKRT